MSNNQKERRKDKKNVQTDTKKKQNFKVMAVEFEEKH